MKKKTAYDHQLHGTFRADRHSKNNTIRFAPASTTAPRYLSKLAKQEWNRVAPMLAEVGAFTEGDISILAAYCTAFAGWRESLDIIAKQGHVITVTSSTRTGQTSKPIKNPAVALASEYSKQMLAISSRFGFTPYDREKLPANDIPEELSLEEELERVLGPNKFRTPDDDDADLYPPIE